MNWWIWEIVGLLLLGLEMLAPGSFFLCFLGVAALIVGLLAALGIVELLSLQLLAYSFLSIVLICFFRRKILSSWGNKANTKDLVGEFGKAQEEISAGSVGKIELRGTSWTARNCGSGSIAIGSRVKVEKVEGITLHVVSV